MKAEGARSHTRWLETALLLVIVTVAALYRLNIAPLDVVPPGCFSDEAHYGLDALAVLDGQHAVFFPDNGGREPLFIYLVAGSVALFGRTVAALRLPAALAGIAAVGLTFLLAREMFRRALGREGALAVATLAGLLLAVSQWHVTFSRIAFRASTTPLLEVLAFWLLWRGLNAIQDRATAPGRATARVAPTMWFALSGTALGACLYTYLSSRFVPLVLIIFFVLWVLFRRLPLPHPPTPTLPWRHLALLVLVAAIVFAPLGAYFALHPGDFLHRAGEASVFNPAWNHGDPLGAFADSAVKAAGMLFWAGDPNWRHNVGATLPGNVGATLPGNVAGQPVLNPVLAILFLLGLGLACWRIWRSPATTLPNADDGARQSVYPCNAERPCRAAPGQPAHLFVIVWLVVMMLPSALTAEGIPNSLRNLAAAPVVYIFPALALVGVWSSLARRASHTVRCANVRRQTSRFTRSVLWTLHVSRFTFSGLTAFILLLTAVLTWHDYFVTWANHPETARAMNADMHVVEVADYMNAHADKDTAFLLLNTYEHPAIAFLYTGELPYASLPDGGDAPATIRQLCQSRSRLLVIQWAGLDPGAMRAEHFALDMLNTYATRTGEEAADPGFAVLAYQLPLDSLFPIRLRDRDARFGDVAHLTGYLFRALGLGPDIASPGSDAWVVLRWQIAGDGDQPSTLKVTLRLLDARGQAVAQLDKALTGPESDHREARFGDDVSDYYRLAIPKGTPPGTYTLTVGVYPPDTLQLLPVTADGQTDVLLTLGPITIQ